MAKQNYDYPPYYMDLNEASRYCGLNVERFNQMVRPFLNEFKINNKTILFKTCELEAKFDDIISSSCERHPEAEKGKSLWADANKYHKPDSDCEMDSGTLEKSIKERKLQETQDVVNTSLKKPSKSCKNGWQKSTGKMKRPLKPDVPLEVLKARLLLEKCPENI